MRFFSILSLSFLLVGANAGVLEEAGYTFKNLGDGICTVTSKQGSDRGELPDKFKVNKADKTITIQHLNIVGDKTPNQLPSSTIMAAVCREFGLEPDNLNKVVMSVYKDFRLQNALDTYRSIHYDMKKDEKIVTTLICPGMGSDMDTNTDRDVWLDLYEFMPLQMVRSMLTINSIVGKISIDEGDDTCLMSYFIEPNEEDDESVIHNFDEYGKKYGDS
ncbi:hypothetical protein HOO65_050472 [Ceratocystis lukuohia]|uniref:Uncharacterized protein n=1 Tax=Ceratocystis lukuohia TaxID=2019550 RepID=A0ABR4MGF4_9PEZI